MYLRTSHLRLALPFALSLVFSAVAQADSNKGMSDYQRWLASTQNEFQNYLDENDKAFISFLKQRWESVDTEKGAEEDTAPKPDSMPVAPPKPITQAPELTREPAPEPTPEVVITLPEPAPVITPKPKPPAAKMPTGPAANLSFYGHALSIPYNSAMTARLRGDISPDTIANGWEKLARSEYTKTQEQLEQARSELALSDWATARLIADFSHKTAPDTRSRTLLSWFLLVKMGFDARLAYNSELYLLMPADDDVFGVTYFTLEGQRYYALPADGKVQIAGSVYTYKKQHESAADPIRFRAPEKFQASGKVSEKTLKFKENGRDINVTLSYPVAQVDYLNTLPQLALPRYPVIEMPDETRIALAAQLKPLLENKSEEAAVNTLLNFVQNAFKYETDDEQFREENYLFPLETIHYRASDCEDRAALFSQLVHDLLGLPVVLLDYPGHVAAAVSFSGPLSGEVQGDALVYNGRQYTVTDPTYINARAGMTMPEYAGKAPDIVTIF